MSRLAVGILCGIGIAAAGVQAFAETKAPSAKPGAVVVPKAEPVPTPAPSGGGTPISTEKKVRFKLGTEAWSDVTGYSGAGAIRRAGAPLADVGTALSGIGIREENFDDPRAAIGYQKWLNNAKELDPSAVYVAYLPPSSDGPYAMDDETKFQQRKFVRGIAICTGDEKNTDDRKIKGMRLFYATVSTDAAVDAVDTEGQKWERTKCKVWHSAKFCDAKKVARAARFHANSKDKWFQGAQLECMTPEVY